ncbi:MAG: hypothetical protein QG597_3182 [Actinomycetota bacterium]|nr:hypothetical protein [Actinomycetota bacterium]
MAPVEATDSGRRSAPPLAAEDAEDGLRPALFAVARHWRAAAAVFLVVVALGTWVAFTLPTAYVAGTVISFLPRDDSVSGKNLASLLVERYPQVVVSKGSVDAAAAAAGVEPSEVTAGLKAVVQSETLNLLVSVQLPTKQQAEAAAESLHATVITDNETDPNLRAVTVSAPAMWGITGTSKTLVLGAVVIVAVILAGVTALIIDGLRRSAPQADPEVSRNPS